MPISVTLGSNQGSLNGVTPVEIVPAPASGVQRAVRSIRFVNKDTGTVTIRVRKLVSGTPYEFDAAVALAVDGKFDPTDGDEVVALTATTHSITALLAAAPATTNPSFVASWVDKATT